MHIETVGEKKAVGQPSTPFDRTHTCKLHVLITSGHIGGTLACGHLTVPNEHPPVEKANHPWRSYSRKIIMSLSPFIPFWIFTKSQKTAFFLVVPSFFPISATPLSWLGHIFASHTHTPFERNEKANDFRFFHGQVTPLSSLAFFNFPQSN